MSDLSNLHYTWKNDPYSSHRIALNWVQNFPEDVKILDIGCASGILGYHLQRDKKYLTGVEPNPNWAHLAKTHYGKIINATLSEVNNDLIHEHSVVVLMDVLEHMSDPYTELARLYRALKPQSYVIISVPNIAHLYIRLMLLFGHFNYSERGILDKTHLRFFTKSSFQKMIIESGISIEQFTVTPVPLPLIHSFFRIPF